MDKKLSKELRLAIKACLEAAKEIMRIYEAGSFFIQDKNDGSPVTIADKRGNEIIQEILKESSYPYMSEEGKTIPFQIRSSWGKYWLVDPIDGTKEFINRNGEFTINIALIDKNTPVLGVVYVPVKNELFLAEKGFGSFKIENLNYIDDIDRYEFTNLENCTYPTSYTLVVSRSHMNSETIEFVNQKKQQHGKIITKSYGSSLKICKVAERIAHCYPRLGPTMEWDTAAAHAIAIYSGAKILNSENNSPITYNKESLLNPNFIVSHE